MIYVNTPVVVGVIPANWLSRARPQQSIVAENAAEQKWVRDPFDRLIVGHASANDAPLVTKDEKIRKHYRRAVW